MKVNYVGFPTNDNTGKHKWQNFETTRLIQKKVNAVDSTS